MLFGSSRVRPLAFAVTEPLAPGAKQAPLQLAQCKNIRVLQTLCQRAKRLLERLENQVAFRDQVTIKLEGGQHPGGNDLLKPALFLAVADHRDLANPIRDPLLLQPQPHFLAVRAPGMVIAVEGDAHLRLGPPEQAQPRLGIGGPLHPLMLQLRLAERRELILQLLPTQGLSQGHRLGGCVHGPSIA